MSRMLRDYIERFYAPEAARSAKLRANDYALAKKIVDWKENVVKHWDDVKGLDVKVSEALNHTIDYGESFDVTVKVDTAGLGPCVGGISDNK